MIVASLGWRAMFFAFGLATLIWLLPWRQVTKSLPARPKGHDEQAVPVRTLLGCPPLWAMGVGHLTSNFGLYFILAWLPLYLVQRGLR
jgi:cyanate permease